MCVPDAATMHTFLVLAVFTETRPITDSRFVPSAADQELKFVEINMLALYWFKIKYEPNLPIP